MELPKDEIAAITRSTSDKQTQILDIVKTWISKNPNKQKEDLQELLMSAKLEDAARRFVLYTFVNLTVAIFYVHFDCNYNNYRKEHN